MQQKARFPLETLHANVPPGVDPWLPPAVVAEIIGLDQKWLAAAREGRKNIQGPPYIKVGEGRTAPVRYKLSSVLAWMASFEERVSGMHRVVAVPQSFNNFMDGESSTDRWLFLVAQDGRTATEFFEALKSETSLSRGRPQWLTRAEYANKRFLSTKLRLDADSLAQLIDIGGGDLATGIAKLLGK